MSDAPDLLTEIESFARRVGLAPATICRKAVGAGHLPGRLRSGGECLPRTARRLRQWMAENPDGGRGERQEDRAA